LAARLIDLTIALWYPLQKGKLKLRLCALYHNKVDILKTSKKIFKTSMVPEKNLLIFIEGYIG
jgi:hypothetical protein